LTRAARDRAVRLFGIVGAWMEEDVIGASVANAFHQGCEQVFLVDNDSPDRTVEVALAAGATLARSFQTAAYDERARIAAMNETMHAVTEREGAEHAWWLWFDADEFPHGPRGEPLARWLSSLDDACRVVGARYFHHFPTQPPHFVEGCHPLELQPLCYEQRSNQSRCSHRKHPLVRLDRGAPTMTMGEGFHGYDLLDTLREAPWSAFIHHFPFREREITLRRMTALCDAGEAGASRIAPQDRHELTAFGARSHASQRFALCDAVYGGRWEEVVRALPGRHSYEIVLADWAREWDVDVWYRGDELARAVARARAVVGDGTRTRSPASGPA
jgi:glycosyltransferase involved in cell wall biosynthesis